MSDENHKAAARAWYHRNKDKARAAKLRGVLERTIEYLKFGGDDAKNQ